MDITRYIKQSNKHVNQTITLKEVENRLHKGHFLTVENAKTTKGAAQGYLTGILYLAPHKITGFNFCSHARTCIISCLFSAGRGGFNSVKRARIIKSLAFLLDPKLFEEKLIKDVQSIVNKAKKLNKTPAIRLNGTSDLIIERVFKKLLNTFPEIQFYDYTKNPNRFNTLPNNYDLTFSYDGTNWLECIKLLEKGYRVSAVFKDSLPSEFFGFEVIDGDTTDLRFLDNGGLIVGLIAKGKAKKENDDTFVITNHLKEETVA